MGATAIPGYRFTQGEQVTPTKLNQMVDLAQIINIPGSEVVLTPNKELSYGGATPALERGRVHYDTTPGYEGLKYAFVSASSASVARWLYRTPHVDGVFWAASGSTLGLPQILAGFAKPFPAQLYDGCLFPLIHPLLGVASGSSLSDNLQLLIPLEGRSSPGPVACAIMGLVPGVFGATPASLGLLFLDSTDPTSIRNNLHTIPALWSLLIGPPIPPGPIPSASELSWLYVGTTFQDSK